ncbi:MAG: hypothetical protein EOM05_11815 [Clostridia bacterium]|nr:hypothetical protein [Clostridia bacterium]
MIFAEKLLVCASVTMLEDDLVTGALRRAINADNLNADPTIYYITTPPVLGYWLIQDENVGYECVNCTEYAPVDSVY